MPQICRQCSRANPAEATYCYFDGVLLHRAPDGVVAAGSINFGARAFSTPFVFPSGKICRSFNELVQVCSRAPAEALDVLRQGYLENFLSSQGRADLAHAARQAIRAPSAEQGLDEFLSRLPGNALSPPALRVHPPEIDLGVVKVGEDRRFELIVRNDGMGLLRGTVTSGASWLLLGEAPGVRQKLFEVRGQTALPVRLRGKSLRAYPRPQKAEISFDTNGGRSLVTVQVQVPVQPFPHGALAGALSPRQLAEKAKAQPNEAAALIESGAVARWYEANGWTYPVQGPTASGKAAVQQLFEALGLVRAPKVTLATRSVRLSGAPGASTEKFIEVFTEERRAVVAHAISDQSWLQVRRTAYNGRLARIPLIVPVIPHEPGVTLRCEVTVTANGNQRFRVPVSLVIGANDDEVYDAVVIEEPPLVEAPLEDLPPPTEADWHQVTAPAPVVEEAPAALAPPAVLPVFRPERGRWRALVPLLLLLGGLVLAIGRDLWWRSPSPGWPELIATPAEGPVTGGELTLIGRVYHPLAGEDLTLLPPEGVLVVDGFPTQSVASTKDGPYGVATWHLRTGTKPGPVRIMVMTNTGAMAGLTVTVRPRQ